MITVFLKSTVLPWESVTRAVFQNLQQDVEHVRVGLLDLVEQHHRVGLAPHGLSELAALIVAHVPGRRPHQAGDRVLLHVLGHVEAHHGFLIPEHGLGQSLAQLGLAHAGGPQEDEGTNGAVLVL